MRMSMRRFTRLTNAFSKKLTNHAHLVALYALWYNFVRQHKTLRMSPAMAAGIENRLWSMNEVAALVEARDEPSKKRSAYKPRNAEGRMISSRPYDGNSRLAKGMLHEQLPVN
jgi:hypothetical protein